MPDSKPQNLEKPRQCDCSGQLLTMEFIPQNFFLDRAAEAANYSNSLSGATVRR